MQRYQTENAAPATELPSTQAMPSFSWDNLSSDYGVSEMMDAFNAEPSVMTVDEEYDAYVAAPRLKGNVDSFGFWTVSHNSILLAILC